MIKVVVDDLSSVIPGKSTFESLLSTSLPPLSYVSVAVLTNVDCAGLRERLGVRALDCLIVVYGRTGQQSTTTYVARRAIRDADDRVEGAGTVPGRCHRRSSADTSPSTGR